MCLFIYFLYQICALTALTQLNLFNTVKWIKYHITRLNVTIDYVQTTYPLKYVRRPNCNSDYTYF